MFASCNSAELPIYPVEGRVLVRGKPAHLTYVVLHPKDRPAVAEKLNPRGKTGPDGFLQLQTYWPADGAPAGDYVATIVWPGPPLEGDPNAYHPDELSRRPDVLKGKHATPDSSPLKVSIQKNPNRLAAFELNPD